MDFKELNRSMLSQTNADPVISEIFWILYDDDIIDKILNKFSLGDELADILENFTCKSTLTHLSMQREICQTLNAIVRIYVPGICMSFDEELHNSYPDFDEKPETNPLRV